MNTVTPIKVPTKVEFDVILTLIQTAINEENQASGTGDKPRCVGLRTRGYPPITPFIPYLTSGKMHMVYLYAITDLWGDSWEEQLDYYLEIFEEFKRGLTFLDEAISY